jgi:hypothetical protein
MTHTIIAAIFIAIAFILGVLAVLLPPENIHFVILISRFFEVMIPILAVGALIKYLCTCYKDKVNCEKNYNVTYKEKI